MTIPGVGNDPDGDSLEGSQLGDGSFHFSFAKMNKHSLRTWSATGFKPFANCAIRSFAILSLGKTDFCAVVIDPLEKPEGKIKQILQNMKEYFQHLKQGTPQ